MIWRRTLFPDALFCVWMSWLTYPCSFFPLFSKYIYALCNDLESVLFTTNSVLRDFENDGVVYLELRTTPRHLPGLTSDEYVYNILECISSFNERSPSMRAHLILSIDRRHKLETAIEVVNVAHKYQSGGVVGIDLVRLPPSLDLNVKDLSDTFTARINYDLTLNHLSSVATLQLETSPSFNLHLSLPQPTASDQPSISPKCRPSLTQSCGLCCHFNPIG